MQHHSSTNDNARGQAGDVKDKLIEKQQHTNHSIKPPRKWKRVLAALLTGATYNRFQAERELHDHALHSTVSNLQARGIVIHRREESVAGFQGAPTRVCRYWLAAESRELARQLLGLDGDTHAGA